ncbi:MAG: DUF6125 family protein [Candidatus Syntropharchaeia archaeon]
MSWAIWITGLPGCGKTTISRKVREKLRKKGIDAQILELDEIRKIITPNPTYSEEEREIVYASLAYIAKLLTDMEKNVIIDATANRRRYRERARSQIKDFLEVYIKCPLFLCIKREKKRKTGIYEKSKEGAPVPGLNVEYEEPENPEVILDGEINPDENAERIIKEIENRFYISEREKYFRSAFVIVDGLWFKEVEERWGLEVAGDVDTAVWTAFASIFARRIQKELNLGDKMCDVIKTISHRWEFEGWDFDANCDEKRGEIIVRKCPWVYLLRRRGKDRLIPNICGRLCEEMYDAWAKTINKGVKLKKGKKIGMGDNCCEFVFEME